MALGALAVFAYRWVTAKLGFAPVSEKEYRELVDPLLREAVAYGVGKLEDANWTKVETKNEAVAIASNYAIDHGKEVLEKFGITEEKLQEKLEAKLIEEGHDTEPGKWEKVEG